MPWQEKTLPDGIRKEDSRAVSGDGEGTLPDDRTDDLYGLD